MIEKLFKSLDEKMFTPEVQASFTTMFNESVEEQAKEISDALVEAEKVILSEQAEEFKIYLAEEAQTLQEELQVQVGLYLDRVVEEFTEEAKEGMKSNIQNERADLMIEAFDSFILAGAVEVSRIAEAKEDGEVETKLAESVEKYDALVEENISMIKENDDLIKMGVISELASALSIVEAEKFETLAAIVEFTRDESYSDKLKLIQESVKGAKVEDLADETDLNEDVKSKTYSHLV